MLGLDPRRILVTHRFARHRNRIDGYQLPQG